MTREVLAKANQHPQLSRVFTTEQQRAADDAHR